MNGFEHFGAAGYVAALCLAAFGSALGTGAAGMAVIGAWKKCLLEDKTPPFILTAFAGAPLSQTIYGLILMNELRATAGSADPMVNFLTGLFGGIAMGASAWM
ncbi:MAG: V-type ATP synthase subunit K, partial [Oceanipulchritudo sp.]